MKTQRNYLEQMLISIGEYVSTEFDNVAEVKYFAKQDGYRCVIKFKDKTQTVLSLD